MKDETHQWSDTRKDQLMEFIKATARGTEFEKDYRVAQTQVLKAWEAFLKNQSADYILEERDAIKGKLDEWDDYFRIDVGGYLRDVELKRVLKSQVVQELVKVFDEWESSNQSFEQDVALEIRDAGRNYLHTYLTMLNRISQGDFMATIDSPIAATVVEQMLHWLPKEQPFEDRLRHCVNFFASTHFANVPNLWLEARIFATLKDMVKRGAFTNRNEALRKLNGVFEDIKHISLYAPYCDAFVMDKFMADLVGRPTVGLEGGVRNFV